MRRGYVAFAVMLCLVLSVKLGLPVLAENTGQGDDGYGRSYAYCEGLEGPISALITAPEGQGEGLSQEEGASAPEAATEKEFSFTTDYTGGQTVWAAIRYQAWGTQPTQEQWQALYDHLAQVLSRAIPNAGSMDAGQMADAILAEILRARDQAVPDAGGQMPIYAREDVTLYEIQVDAPYYPALQRGSRGDEVTALQQRLIELGYLEGEADGQFGSITAAAVEAAQTHLRSREQAQIDAMIAAQPTPSPTPAPTPEPTPDPQGVVPQAQATPEPEPTPEPTPAPTPATQVDGVAGQALQIRLFSDEFPLIDGDLDKGADAQAVIRLQRRLVQLGCLTGGVDGDYGSNTRRGVRIFQHYNGLEETGVADEATQRAIFSAAAQAPSNPLMEEGSEGEAVKALQQRLITLGFMKGTVDGDYGSATRTGVENLQAYLREKEIETLTAQAQAAQAMAGVVAAPEAAVSPDASPESAQPTPTPIAVTPTVEVNGVADPLLLEAFYAEDFPEIPSLRKNGDSDLEVSRIQRRLQTLEYIYTAPDGAYGDATETAVRDFQKRNGLSQDGVAGEDTLRVLFSEDALKALKPYVLKVSISKQRVYAYGLDENNEHTVLVRTMICSTGLNSTPTPKGTYQASTGPGARWHYFKKFSCWAQYAYYIEGDIMFHSVLYNQKGGAVTSSSVRNLGSKASHGCVRLKVEDAKWIYQNCPPNTKIIVY